jgi:ABC-2 type transport system permease protein
MSNVIAIAQKEVRAYFVSPIAYVVLTAFALLYGYFFVMYLIDFQSMSMQMGGMGGGGPMNVNQGMIRPVLYNAAVVLLFMVPAMTMRAYAEEKRSGTIELLITSPVSDFQILIGKFLGVMALYGVMIALTFVHIALLFLYGKPEWRPIASAYLGLLLMGGAMVSVGVLVSSLTKNQISAAVVTFSLLLMFWVIGWVVSFAPPPFGDVLNYLSITSHLDDFTKGVIDTRHVIYYLSFITFGLFLTAKAVDSERWRG